MKKLESDITTYMKERRWDNLRPSDLAKSISIEAAELLELFQWDSMTIRQTLKDKEKMRNIRDELADIMIYCLELSVSLKLNTEDIVRKKLERAAAKYPADIMRKAGKGKKSDAYYKIKKEYRTKRIS